jgi:hypothetical protein
LALLASCDPAPAFASFSAAFFLAMADFCALPPPMVSSSRPSRFGEDVELEDPGVLLTLSDVLGFMTRQVSLKIDLCFDASTSVT